MGSLDPGPHEHFMMWDRSSPDWTTIHDTFSGFSGASSEEKNKNAQLIAHHILWITWTILNGHHFITTWGKRGLLSRTNSTMSALLVSRCPSECLASTARKALLLQQKLTYAYEYQGLRVHCDMPDTVLLLYYFECSKTFTCIRLSRGTLISLIALLTISKTNQISNRLS